MASEIQLAYGVTGRTLYAVVYDTTGRVWNGAAFVAFNAPDWGTYAVTVTEQGASGYYTGDFPVVTGGAYNVAVRDRSGGSPAVGDPVAGSGQVYWTGTAVQSLAAVGVSSASITAIATAVWAFVALTGFTVVQILRGLASFVMGKASGGGTAAPTFRDLNDTKDVIAMTVDASGNRTDVDLDLD